VKGVVLVKTVLVSLRGTSPLLMHRWSERSEIDSSTNVRQTNVRHGTPREEAEEVAYRTPEGLLYMPSSAVVRCFREAASDFKQRGKRQSMKYAAGAAFIPAADIILFNPTLTDYEVDSRPVVIPATKGRIMRHRPRLNAWRLVFYVEVDTDLIGIDTAHQIMTAGGALKGLGDYRPEKGGPFGRFAVETFVEWNGQDDVDGVALEAEKLTERDLSLTGNR
jgi:hypothetical protein